MQYTLPRLLQEVVPELIQPEVCKVAEPLAPVFPPELEVHALQAVGDVTTPVPDMPVHVTETGASVAGGNFCPKIVDAGLGGFTTALKLVVVGDVPMASLVLVLSL
jgi:hypothetical protein